MLSERQLVHAVARRAREILGRQGPVTVEMEPLGFDGKQADLLIRVAQGVLGVECKSSARQATLVQAMEHLQRLAERRGWIPLVAVPYMTVAGAALCEERGMGWLDASGNAEIVADGLYIHIRGEPNQYKRPGRPANVFATRSSRLTRWLLMHPGAHVTQAELAKEAKLDPGMTSRVVRSMEDRELLQRHGDGSLSVVDPQLLLTSWAERYRFDSHERMPAVIASRSGVDGMRRLAEALGATGREHAFTGLPAAWQYDQHAMFRLCSVFVRSPLVDLDLTAMELHPTERGANVWLLSPDDDGVFEGSQEIDGVRCVHPLQAWLDLGAHPERAAEAAEVLHRRVLGGVP